MRDKKGFTLIELLIVVVIIGILAAIAIPKFSQTREKAYFSAMKSDLKNLATEQELWYADNYEYASDVTDLEFSMSNAVTVTITAGNSTGWAATAAHDGLDAADGCGIYYGDATAPALGGADQAGEIKCTDDAG